MINEDLLVEKLLYKYRFTEPVPVEYKKYIAFSKRDNLVYLLRKHRNYSIVLWCAIFVYMLLRKLGVAVSFFQAALISGVTAAAVAVTVTVGSVKVAGVVKEKIEKKTTNVLNEHPAVPEEKIIPGGKSVILMRFTGTEGAGVLSESATTIFEEILKQKLGGGSILLGKPDAGMKYIITGSVEKLPEGYLLTARVIEKSSSVILHMDMREIHDEEALKSESRRMAGEMAEKLK